MTMTDRPIWLAAGLRTPFVRIDNVYAARDSLSLSVPVVQAMAANVKGGIDFGVWGAVVGNLAYANLAREVWLEAKLDPHVPTFTTIMQCSTSMVGVFQAASILAEGNTALAVVGGVESMTRVQIGLSSNLSVWLRKMFQARNLSQRAQMLQSFRFADLRLYIPEVKNRVTGRSMGEHTEDMAKDWAISRAEQDQLALQSHRAAVAGQGRGFFDDLIIAFDGVSKDQFPRADASLEALGKLRPVFDRSARGTITAGNSSPLTDGAAGIFVASDEGLSRLPSTLPRARLIDYEMAAVDIFHEGLLMAPVSAIPRLLSRHNLTYGDIALWEIHEAFSAQVACHLKALEDKDFVRAKAGVENNFGPLPRERMNPNGGSVALGHPFAATGARILSQAVKELAAMPQGSHAIVSICADGGLGTVALLRN